MAERLRQAYPQTSMLSRVAYDSDAGACILAIIDTENTSVLVGTRDVHIPEVQGGEEMHFVGALIDNIIFEEKADPFDRKWKSQTVTLRIMGEHLPLDDMRRAGIVLQDMIVDIYWHIVGRDVSLSESMHLLRGRVMAPTYDSRTQIATIQVTDRRMSNDNLEPFPPVVATSTLLANLDTEAHGKVYPIVFGDVKKLPVFKIDEPAGPPKLYRYLVMLDQYTYWTSGDTPVDNGGIYNGDDEIGTATYSAQNRDTDTDSNGYWYFDLDTDPASRDITCDVTGYEPATPAGVLRYLLNYLGKIDGWKRDTLLYEQNDIERLESIMQGVTMGFAINEQVRNGVLDIIERVCNIVPIAAVQRGRRYRLIPLTWDRVPVAHLRTDDNILSREGSIAETPRRDVYNQFTVDYIRSGFRGDYQGTLTRDWDSDAQCKTSAERYGKRSFGSFDAGDLADLQSALWIMNWLIETYSKVRVYISYNCRVEAGLFEPWQTVRVFDEDEGWDHGPLFKIQSISRTDGSPRLSLVSIDDLNEVYGLRY